MARIWSLTSASSSILVCRCSKIRGSTIPELEAILVGGGAVYQVARGYSQVQVRIYDMAAKFSRFIFGRNHHAHVPCQIVFYVFLYTYRLASGSDFDYTYFSRPVECLWAYSCPPFHWDSLPSVNVDEVDLHVQICTVILIFRRLKNEAPRDRNTWRLFFTVPASQKLQ
jgi:hypothetical protein